MRNFKFDCQGFIIGYDIESLFLYSLFTTRPYFTRKATPPPWPVERSFLINGIRKFCFLLRNVSFSAITSMTFSFRYNSSSFRFDLIPWQFQNKMFVPMKWSTDTCHGWNALLWPKVAGTYLEVIGFFGATLVVLLVGDMDFKIVDGFVMRLWTGFTLMVVNVNGLGVGWDAERTDAWLVSFV